MGDVFHREKSAFPPGVFVLYMFSFGGQAIYTTYINLYLSSIGYDQSRIGFIVSVSTIFVLLAQMLWGFAGDRAKTKNIVVSFLFLVCSGCMLLFYASTDYWFVLGAVSLYTALYSGVSPVMESLVLEASETHGWDYGKIRAGGTLGYCLTVLFIGFVINDAYSRIFLLAATALLVCFLLTLRLPKVPGHRSGREKTPFRVVLNNRPLIALILFSLVFSMGISFFYSFYPIYFRTLGGTSAQIGVMMFFCAVTEIPCLMVANRVVSRFGVDKVLIVCGLVTCLRWLLLFWLSSPVLIIAANMLHGIGYTGFSYCIITYINDHVPKDLRAASQSFNALAGTVCSRLLFGYIGGLASEAFGANRIMLVACVSLAAATGIFTVWSRRNHQAYVPADKNGESFVVEG